MGRSGPPHMGVLSRARLLCHCCLASECRAPRACTAALAAAALQTAARAAGSRWRPLPAVRHLTVDFCRRRCVAAGRPGKAAVHDSTSAQRSSQGQLTQQCICTRCCVCARPASPCATGPSPSTSPTALHFLARHACLRRCLVGDGSALGLAGAFEAMDASWRRAIASYLSGMPLHSCAPSLSLAPASLLFVTHARRHPEASRMLTGARNKVRGERHSQRQS